MWLRQVWNTEASCLFLKCQDGMADVCQQDEAYPGCCAAHSWGWDLGTQAQGLSSPAFSHILLKLPG